MKCPKFGQTVPDASVAHTTSVQICVGDKVFSNRFPCGEEENRLKTRAYLGETARYSARLETFRIIAGSTCATKFLHYQHEMQQNCCIWVHAVWLSFTNSTTEIMKHGWILWTGIFMGSAGDSEEAALHTWNIIWKCVLFIYFLRT